MESIMLLKSALLLGGPRSLAHTGLHRSGGSRHTTILAIVLAFLLGPTLAWAAAPVTAGAQVQRTTAAATSTLAPTEDKPSSQDQGYASREARSKGLEKFEGGDTTVVIGGSALVIILVVLLIVILL
jgi:hypothetical protein